MYIDHLSPWTGYFFFFSAVILSRKIDHISVQDSHTEISDIKTNDVSFSCFLRVRRTHMLHGLEQPLNFWLPTKRDIPFGNNARETILLSERFMSSKILCFPINFTSLHGILN